MKNIEELAKSSIEFANLPKTEKIQATITKYKDKTNEKYSIFRVITFNDEDKTACVYDFKENLDANDNSISVCGAALYYDNFIKYKNKYGEYEALNNAESITLTYFIILSDNIHY